MYVLDPATRLRLLFITGLINLAVLTLIFLSCRSTLGSKLMNRMLKNKWFKAFYGAHIYFWWILYASLIAHVALAFWTFGYPF
ncbi:MAG: hypothetical protein HY801_00140 [Candidatus Lindowbacteria bacterium]|nr:hypothetical protein [Candidatus Lindowbacteria bacterium]